jgi:phenylacetate-CoA ligase
MPMAELHRLRDKKIQKIVKLCYNKVPFYKEYMDMAKVKPGDIKTYDDLQKIPVWSKPELRKGQAEQPPYGPFISEGTIITEVAGSTGTTGKPTYQIWSRDDMEKAADILARDCTMAGLKPGDIVYQCYPMGFARGYHWGLLACRACEMVGAGFVAAGVGPDIPDRIGFIAEAKPNCYIGPVRLALTYGNLLRDKGMESPFELLTIAGDLGPIEVPKMRERFKDAHPKGEVFSLYAGTETSTVSIFECNEHVGQHVWYDSLALELVDPKTRERVSPEERGEAIINNLVLEGMPVVRYSMADILDSYDDNPEVCGCGRTHGRLWGGMAGRTKDIVSVAGTELLPKDVENAVLSINELSGNYQYVVITGKEVEALRIKAELVKGVEPTKELEKKISDELGKALGVPVMTKLAKYGEIPPPLFKMERIIDLAKF